jgi:hypothetical protein
MWQVKVPRKREMDLSTIPQLVSISKYQSARNNAAPALVNMSAMG